VAAEATRASCCPPGEFPAQLHDAPDEHRIDETFGWFPASLCIASISRFSGRSSWR